MTALIETFSADGTTRIHFVFLKLCSHSLILHAAEHKDLPCGSSVLFDRCDWLVKRFFFSLFSS